LRKEDLHGLRALVVDDNRAAREIMASMVQPLGILVSTAIDGNQAQEMVCEAQRGGTPFDLLLMDWRMPILDGIECASEIQKSCGPTAPAIIMVTAFGREDVLDRARDLGVNLSGIVSKPVTNAALMQTIGHAMGKVLVHDAAPVSAQDAKAIAIRHLAGARVLLVEDNEMNQELVLDLLARAQVDVVVADNGQLALEQLAVDSRFDGILMDCQMPVMDGYTATMAIRSQSAYDAIPIIAMTANAMADELDRIHEVGMDDYIAKPLNVERMYVTMAQWIHPLTSPDQIGSTPAASNQPEQTPKPSSALDGIDTVAGLAVCGDNDALYQRMLEKFRMGHRSFKSDFEAAHSAGHWGNAVRLAHTLRGTAGNIGAIELNRAAEQLETACKNESVESKIATLLAVVQTNLDHVLGGLDRAHTPEPESNANTVDIDRVIKLAAQLDVLLKNNDLDAFTVSAEIKSSVQGSRYESDVARLVDAVERFAIDEALLELNRIRTALEEFKE
jgi:CheY-like chemotaxis protein